MKRFLTVAGAALTLALPAAFAQSPQAAPPATPAPEAEAPQAQQAAPNPMVAAVQGMQVAVLQNSDGGIASVQSEAGNRAIVAFMTPSLAEAQRQTATDDTLQVGIVDLAAILSGWNGGVIFQSSPAEIQQAKALDPETEEFMAPVFLVMSDDMEAQLQTQNGRITPILTGYANAQTLAQNLGASGEASEGDIKIVPLEFATLLQAIGEYGEEAGYRFFTHPEMVAALNAQPGEQAEAAPPQE